MKYHAYFLGLCRIADSLDALWLSLGTEVPDPSQGYITQNKASHAKPTACMLRHVTRVGGLCELHLNLAKWKQTKHIVCVRMKASLWRAVTEGFWGEDVGYQAAQESRKALFLNDRVSMGLSYMSERRNHTEKKPVTSQEYNSPLILSFVKNVHAPFARGLRHLGLSLDCFWRRFPCTELFYLRLRMTSISGKKRRLRERLRCDRIAVRILSGWKKTPEQKCIWTLWDL